MKLTKSQLKKIIKEELNEMIGDQEKEVERGRLEHKFKVDGIIKRVIELSDENPLHGRGSHIATKNNFLIYLQDTNFDWASPSATEDEVENIFRRWHPRIK